MECAECAYDSDSFSIGGHRVGVEVPSDLIEQEEKHEHTQRTSREFESTEIQKLITGCGQTTEYRDIFLSHKLRHVLWGVLDL